jgi:Uma2 family endonuclease
MKTAQRFGPSDHGSKLSFDEFMRGRYQEGYQYELIDETLYVSPRCTLPENLVECWVFNKLSAFSRIHMDVINYITNKAQVFVPRHHTTVVQPDCTAYHNLPLHLPFAALSWCDVSPLFVVEILSHDDPDKDLIRNLELYLQVPSIKEYWILDGRKNVERPSMIVHRRVRGKWQTTEIEPSSTHSTPLLPGFRLTLNIRS